MNFFLDIEATQPENEIISIGIVADNGQKFYSLVKPSFSELTPYVFELTHISQEDLAQANTIDHVLYDINYWLLQQNVDWINDNFYSYGEDVLFFEATLPAIKDDFAFTIAAKIMAKLEDITKTVFKFFHGSISLINAYNYINSIKEEQLHNSLEDAVMLQAVVSHMQNNTPPSERPAIHGIGRKPGEITGRMPRGKFYASTGKKFKNEIEFENIEEAIDWLVNTYVNSADRPNVHRKRIALKIMKALRSKTTYCNYYWRRVKEKKEEETE